MSDARNAEYVGRYRPRLLDLFCGAGGATAGYQRAGFYVVGVDVQPQPYYCGDEFHQADAMAFSLDGYDAIHASPPCQRFTQMSARWRGKATRADDHDDLLTPTRERFRSLAVPWVIENVQGAVNDMSVTLMLHGGMFGLGVHRPRMFESNVLLMAPKSARCVGAIGVYGDKPDGRRLHTTSPVRAASSLREAQIAMGMDWADWHGTKEAIPPAYTEWIGAQLPLSSNGSSETDR
jgi:DNA (cytosine-5)-methyltransferase 1